MILKIMYVLQMLTKQKSKLRQIAEENGYKCGIIHDDCGGRFGAFDDHSLSLWHIAVCRKKK